jgi:plastocyanin
MHSKRFSEDTMKRIALIAVAILGAIMLTGCGSSSSTPKPQMPMAGTDGAKAASLIVEHATAGCHNWSLNGSPMSAHQVARLQHGNGITVTNNDVMPHELVQTAGPTVQMAGMQMSMMGAQSTVVFPTAGVYKFTTKAGEDYPSASGIVTTGEDNVLTLTVYVS